MKEIHLVRTPSRKLNVSIDTASLYGVVIGGVRTFISKEGNKDFSLRLVNGITLSNTFSLHSSKNLDALITNILNGNEDNQVFQFDNTNEFLLWLAGRNNLGTKIEFLETEILSLNSPPRMLQYYGVEGDGLKFYITQQSDGLFAVKTPSLMLHTSCIKTGNNISELMINLLKDGYRIIEFETYHNLLDWLAS